MSTLNIKVFGLSSPMSGENVRNQYTIRTDKLTAFQSYDSLIAVCDHENSRLTVGRDWDYSNTTLKYFHQWLEEYVTHHDSKIKSYTREHNGNISKLINGMIESGIINYDEEMK